jgi:membrane protein YdbS with pleckstrin-like domain
MKPCPFCKEQIQDEAIKCRFCGSMLTAQAPAPLAGGGGGAAAAGGGPAIVPQGGDAHPIGHARVLFDGSPSWKSWFWPYTGATLTTIVGLALAGWLGVAYSDKIYLALIGAAVAVFGVVWFLVEHFRRIGLRIKVTTETIDLERGVFGKRIDTIQLWRVRDIDFRQSIMERILGVSTIHVLSHDQENPNVLLRGISGGRALFDELRDAIAVSRQGRNVVGMVD